MVIGHSWALLLLVCSALPAHAQDEIVLTRGVFIDRVVRSGRELVRIDPVAHGVAAGLFAAPKAGDVVQGPGGERAWAASEANDKGQFDPSLGRGGYGYFEVESDAQRVMVFEAVAHGMVYIASEPRMGDPYASGDVGIPVKLAKGTTPLLVAMGGRAPFRGRLRAPRAPVEIDTRDLTLPDLVHGERDVVTWAGVVLRNCTDTSIRAKVEWRLKGAEAWTQIREVSLAPLCTDKPGLRIPLGITPEGERVEVELRVTTPDVAGEDTATLTWRVRRAAQSRKVHYNSMLDGSVQYYAVVPPAQTVSERPGLVLSLHGASVEATNQANSYAAKPDTWIVCPTNRRPFGFDWESFGREDAMSVLKAASRWIRPDPTRIYLTGHSMGGHGSWHLATLYPDRFAAVAPSAGWISFESYAGARGAGQNREDQDPIRAMLVRAACTSDTLAHATNLASMGVFILHGDADDNVPVSEARAMAKALEAFHHDWRFHEEAGAGHWWDSGEWKDHAGASCVDFPPIFDYFAARRLPHPGEVRRIDFLTSNPSVSSYESGWASIIAQEQRLRPSRIVLDFDPATRRVRGTTTNVRALALSPDLRGESGLSLTLDGQTIEVSESSAIILHKGQGAWRQGDEIDPVPPGSFVDAYAGFVFVYATGGMPELTAQSLAHARYDAEQWWVRGNGSARILADHEYLSMDEHERPIVSMLYGNEETNLAWASVIPDPQLSVRAGRVRLGSREIAGSAGVLCVQRGRDGSPVGIIAGTDLHASKMLQRLPLFVSGVGVPEIVVIRPDFLSRGEASIIACGLLSSDWRIDAGELVFRDEQPE